MSEMQEAVVTLYSAVASGQVVLDACFKCFDEVLKKVEQEDDEVTLVLQDDTTLVLHIQTDPPIVEKQIVGMHNFYAKVPAKKQEVHKQVLTQITLFNCITGVSFFLNEDENRTSFIMGSLFEVAQDSASIILYPNMSLFTPTGELLLSMEGESDVEIWHPIAHTGILEEALVYSEEDQARYQRIHDELKQRGFPAVSYLLSTQRTLSSIDAPETIDIARRCLCLFACAVCAEGTLMEEGSREIGRREFDLLEKRFSISAYLSEKEHAFLYGEEPEASVCVQFSWGYEACAVLLWALGLYEINEQFTTICDVAKMASLLRDCKSIEELCTRANPRSKKELLELHTRVLYYNWSCVEARIHHQELKGIELGVIAEAHHALNWLCNANHTRNWDAITCNT